VTVDSEYGRLDARKPEHCANPSTKTVVGISVGITFLLEGKHRCYQCLTSAIRVLFLRQLVF
jgi:hypothetical protein